MYFVSFHGGSILCHNLYKIRRIHECTSNESLLPIKPFTAKQMASIKKLKNPSHTNNSSKQFKKTPKGEQNWKNKQKKK
jgi:hypothetical protein